MYEFYDDSWCSRSCIIFMIGSLEQLNLMALLGNSTLLFLDTYKQSA